MRTGLSALVLLGLGTLAHAEPIDAGNVRVSVTCTTSVATPDRGLVATLDGAPLPSIGDNTQLGAVADEHGNVYVTSFVTDVGFRAPVGHHHLELSAPQCLANGTDIDVVADHAVAIGGRLPIEPAWRGPTGAPNGFGLALGVVSLATPASELAGHDAGAFPSDWTAAPHRMTGVALSSSIERWNLVGALDVALAWGDERGEIADGSGNRTTFADSLTMQDFTLRLGARVPLDHVALAAGSGIGVSVFEHGGGGVMQPPNQLLVILPPSGIDASLHIPAWASLTVKPTCDLGVTAMASYEWAPTNSAASGIVLTAGLMWQPNDACRERPGLVVRR